MRRVINLGVVVAGMALVLSTGCGDGVGVTDPLYPGQTEFTNHEPGYGDGRYEGGGLGLDSSNKGGAAPPAPSGQVPGAPPSGRVAEVEEADIYKVKDNRLFYLNTYRGFLIYDLTDPKKPKQISRLPVYGYPIEMFIQGNTVYALITDALYLTQVKGKLQFKRHNVSQLVAIDISDLSNPKVLQERGHRGPAARGGLAQDRGHDLRRLLHLSATTTGAGTTTATAPASRRSRPGSTASTSPTPRTSAGRQLQDLRGGRLRRQRARTTPRAATSSGVTISATSNALMVVENWRQYGYFSGSPYNCGSSVSLQQARGLASWTSATPRARSSVHAKFRPTGQLGDQFKQTYVYDKTTGKAHLPRHLRPAGVELASNCSGSSIHPEHHRVLGRHRRQEPQKGRRAALRQAERDGARQRLRPRAARGLRHHRRAHRSALRHQLRRSRRPEDRSARWTG